MQEHRESPPDPEKPIRKKKEIPAQAGKQNPEIPQPITLYDIAKRMLNNAIASQPSEWVESLKEESTEFEESKFKKEAKKESDTEIVQRLEGREKELYEFANTLLEAFNKFGKKTKSEYDDFRSAKASIKNWFTKERVDEENNKTETEKEEKNVYSSFAETSVKKLVNVYAENTDLPVPKKAIVSRFSKLHDINSFSNEYGTFVYVLPDEASPTPIPWLCNLTQDQVYFACSSTESTLKSPITLLCGIFILPPEGVLTHNMTIHSDRVVMFKGSQIGSSKSTEQDDIKLMVRQEMTIQGGTINQADIDAKKGTVILNGKNAVIGNRVKVQTQVLEHFAGHIDATVEYKYGKFALGEETTRGDNAKIIQVENFD